MNFTCMEKKVIYRQWVPLSQDEDMAVEQLVLTT